MRLQLSVFLFVCVCLAHAAGPAKLPDTFKLCKNDGTIEACLREALPIAFVALKDTGIPELGVPSLDPLHVTAVEIGQGQGPISISMNFANITVTGLSKSRVHDQTKVDLKGIKLEFNGDADVLTFDADYELSGRILLLPITGKGRCKLIFTKLAATAGPVGAVVQKKGKDYFDVRSFKLDLNSLEKLQVHFDNLFNGDKTLGNSMNALLNENWKDLWGELRPAFEETFGAIFLQYSKRIFDKVPMKDIFLDP